MSKQIVITIHGVNPDRQWQERVGKVLSPHFECKTFAYHGYDSIFGPVRAVANVTFFVIAFALICAAVYFFLSGNWTVAILLLTAGVAAFVLSIVIAWALRVHNVHFIKQEINKASAYGRPHVVAHSLGTYLIGSVLKKFPDIRLGKVVLVSSVLPQTYPWQGLLQERPQCIHQVRNEFGTADSVTKLVGKLQWLVRDLGQSGAVGFDEDEDIVHTSESPEDDCALCRTAPAKLHNVPLKDFAHSTEFLGDGHARKLWLPFLWGYSPGEFLRYLEMCQAAAHLQEERRWNEMDEVVTQLGETVFAWTGNQPLEDYVKNYITAYLKRLPLPVTASVEDLTEKAMTVLHVVVDEACIEAGKEGSIDENVVRGLHPPAAIVRAVERIIEEQRSA